MVDFELSPDWEIEPRFITLFHEFGCEVHGSMIPEKLFGYLTLLDLDFGVDILIFNDLLRDLFDDGSGPSSVEVGLEVLAVTIIIFMIILYLKKSCL